MGERHSADARVREGFCSKAGASVGTTLGLGAKEQKERGRMCLMLCVCVCLLFLFVCLFVVVVIFVLLFFPFLSPLRTATLFFLSKSFLCLALKCCQLQMFCKNRKMCFRTFCAKILR